MNLDRIASHRVATLSVADTLNAAMQQMWNLNIRHLPVLRNDIPVGMVSERDVLFHVCWIDRHQWEGPKSRRRLLSGASRIEDVMTSPLITLSPGDPVEKGARLMLNKRISSIPLAVGDCIVGIVTESDFLRCYFTESGFALSNKTKHDRVLQYMTTRVSSVGPEEPTLNAIRLMRDGQFRHLPVVHGGRLVGIVSDRDVLRGGPRREGGRAISVLELRVKEQSQVCGIMSTDLEVLSPDATLSEAAVRFVGKKIGALPIVEDQKLVGMITETDLLRAFVTDSVLDGPSQTQAAVGENS